MFVNLKYEFNFEYMFHPSNGCWSEDLNISMMRLSQQIVYASDEHPAMSEKKTHFTHRISLQWININNFYFCKFNLKTCKKRIRQVFIFAKHCVTQVIDYNLCTQTSAWWDYHNRLFVSQMKIQQWVNFLFYFGLKKILGHEIVLIIWIWV